MDNTSLMPNPSGKRSFWETVAIMLFFAAVGLLFFRSVLFSGDVLFTTDDNIGEIALRKNDMPYAFLGRWSDLNLLGIGGYFNFNWTNLLMWILPVKVFTDSIHAIDLVLGSIFFALFLRQRSVSFWGQLLGGLAAFWVGSYFTLTSAGHISKFAVLMLAAASLLCIEKTVRTRRLEWSLLAGGGLGAMFLEQIDVALFFSFLIGAYLLYAVWRDHGFGLQSVLRMILPALVLAGLVAFRPLWEGYRTIIGSEANRPPAESKSDEWNFITQWSWPPEESIDFVAPGYTGWRSGEPEGPYWGRMGRSAEWEETSRGFQNFKLENQYIGAIPVLFALFALFVAWSRRQMADDPMPGNRRWRADIYFWSAATVLSLLLSFGKFFPLYSLFYHLPVVSSIRNPNKFLQIFQLALAVLTAFGVSFACGKKPDGGPVVQNG